MKPALELLAAPEFDEANREFRLAHEHYRSGDLRDCNTAAFRSMEAVLKAICNSRGWQYDAGATVEKLIGEVRARGLFPDYLGGYFDNLIGAMKAGLPKIRDKDGGHGAAPGDRAVPEHIAGFALHLAASNIVLLAQAHRSLPLPASRQSERMGSQRWLLGFWPFTSATRHGLMQGRNRPDWEGRAAARIIDKRARGDYRRRRRATPGQTSSLPPSALLAPASPRSA